FRVNRSSHKTGPHMNARNGHFVNRKAALGAKLLASTMFCALAGGCVSGNPLTDGQVDPRSPIATAVAGSVKADAPYPTCAAIPARPKDVRPLRQFGVATAQIDKAAADLARETAPDKFSLQDTATFAAQAQAAAGPEAPADAAAQQAA